MKIITVGSVRYKFPNKMILAAYAGACAAHQLQRHENWFKETNKGDFLRLFKFVVKNIRGIVQELPKKLTLKCFVESAPANREFGGF